MMRDFNVNAVYAVMHPTTDTLLTQPDVQTQTRTHKHTLSEILLNITQIGFLTGQNFSPCESLLNFSIQKMMICRVLEILLKIPASRVRLNGNKKKLSKLFCNFTMLH